MQHNKNDRWFYFAQKTINKRLPWSEVWEWMTKTKMTNNFRVSNISHLATLKHCIIDRVGNSKRVTLKSQKLTKKYSGHF